MISRALLATDWTPANNTPLSSREGRESSLRDCVVLDDMTDGEEDEDEDGKVTVATFLKMGGSSSSSRQRHGRHFVLNGLKLALFSVTLRSLHQCLPWVELRRFSGIRGPLGRVVYRSLYLGADNFATFVDGWTAAFTFVGGALSML